MQPDDDKTQAVMVLTKGTVVGHYRIVEKIGAGGMGEVYLAVDTELNRRVALKFLSPHLCQDADCRVRFKREAQAAAKLDHPNIVTVYEVGEYQSRPFFAMQHIEGQSLREYAHEHEPTIPRVLEIGIQLAEGLQAAHEKGVTHRDIKPANVLIDTHGRARILDFGLASVAGTDHLTKTGSTLGTIGHMSPEQVRGEQVDHRTDIFSLGVVLYELIAGRPPFKGDNEAATSRNIVDRDPEPLARYKSVVPDELQRIVSKALARDKALRYQHADELSADLRSMVSLVGRATIAQKPRRRIVIPLLIVLGVLVSVLIFRPWRTIMRSNDEEVTARKRIVVVPFENRTGDSSFDQLGKMVADWTTQSLLATGFGEIVPTEQLPRNTANLRLGSIVDSTGAEVIAMGTVYKFGDSIQFQAKVMNSDGKLLRAIDPISIAVTRVMDGVESVRQRILGALAIELDVSHGHRYVGIARPPRYEAYQEYILGEQNFDDFDMVEALKHYEQAYNEDTTFLETLFGCQATNWNLGRYDTCDSLLRILESHRAQLTEARQLHLDKTIANTSGNWPRALEIDRKLRKLIPGPWVSYSLGWQAMAVNCPLEAIKAFASIEVKGDSKRLWSPYWDFYARAYHALGNYEKELEVARKGRIEFPEALDVINAELRAYAAMGRTEELDKILEEYQSRPAKKIDCTQSTICNLGMTLQATGEELRAHGFENAAMTFLGRSVEWYRRLSTEELLPKRLEYAQVLAEHRQYSEAKSLLDQLLKEEPDSLDYRGWLGIVAAKQGDQVVTESTLAWLQGLKHRYGWHTYYRACIAAAENDKEQAIVLLKESIANGTSYWITQHREFAFENLRDYPPFIEILRPKE
jgi:serine/threonine protein kinase/predicted Zn-dependent protease